MKQIIDFTKMRISKKNQIVKCPDCGRKGRLTKYTNGDAGIAHKGYIELGFLTFEREGHCYIKNWSEVKS